MLETLDDPQIKRMSMDTPEKLEDEFSTEHLLTKEDKEMIEEVIGFDVDNSWVRLAANYKRLNSDWEVQPKDLRRMTGIYEAWLSKLQSSGDNDEVMILLLEARWGMHVFGMKCSTEPNIKQIKAYLERIRVFDRNYSLLAEWLVKAKKIWPDRNFEDPRDRQEILEMSTGGSNFLRIEKLSNCKFLYPDKDFMVTDEEWRIMAHALEETKQKRAWNYFCDLLYKVRQIQPEAKVSISTSNPTIPEVRNF